MTPRTRTTNKDANFKVYYSKKVPQQVHFPHRRKTVRRRDTAEQDAVDKRQMRFLPEKMRQPKTHDQEALEDEETEEDLTAEQAVAAEERRSMSTEKRKGRKRTSKEAREQTASEDEPVVSSSKRRRRTTAPNDEPSRALRRQSTMTQLAEGRRPSFGDDEPDFKPVKRRTRVSWSCASTEEQRDKKQRTLTQMIPGMGRLSKEELEELSDLDADLDEDQAGNSFVSYSLIEQGLVEVDEPAVTSEAVRQSIVAADANATLLDGEFGALVPADLHNSLVSQSIEAAAEDTEEDNYQPTQFIDAPTLRTRQTPRRTTVRHPSNNADGLEKGAMSRFSLLSTPEKRRVFEIPSSQSPAESVLSTQISPRKSNRSALRERNDNISVVAETPSKRRQVTFREPTIQPAPPAHLKKFESTIQDSEDEGSDLEGDIFTQQASNTSEQALDRQAIDAETQAILLQIDRRCAEKDEDRDLDVQAPSDKLGGRHVRQRAYQPSPELGESWAPVIYDDDGPQFESYRSSRTSAKSQSFQAADSSKDFLPVFTQTQVISQLDLTTQGPMPIDNIPSTPPIIRSQPEDNIPSTPMVLRDESSDEEADPGPTLPRTGQRSVPDPPSTLRHQSADLDGGHVQASRSASADRGTQQSHSSKAEQQLQNEWLSYSQYVHARAPNSFSMHATADASSYNATPRLPELGAPVASSARIQHSQATTVDELTPRKNRTQRVISANTTPHRVSKSQPFVSPEKPPSLYIPSSFPSPSKTAMEEWSSPVVARTQTVYGSSQVLGSLEDFSIPLPPPIEDD